ncbi:hypothetical protein VPH35_054720 [Triticum aestivum]
MWAAAAGLVAFPAGGVGRAAPLHGPGERRPSRLRHVRRRHGRRSGRHAPAGPGLLPAHGFLTAAAAALPQRRRLSGWGFLARSAERGSDGHGAEPGARHLLQQLRRFVADGPHENGALTSSPGKKLDPTGSLDATAVHREEKQSLRVSQRSLPFDHPWKHSEIQPNSVGPLAVS